MADFPQSNPTLCATRCQRMTGQTVVVRKLCARGGGRKATGVPFGGMMRGPGGEGGRGLDGGAGRGWVERSAPVSLRHDRQKKPPSRKQLRPEDGQRVHRGCGCSHLCPGRLRQKLGIGGNAFISTTRYRPHPSISPFFGFRRRFHTLRTVWIEIHVDDFDVTLTFYQTKPCATPF